MARKSLRAALLAVFFVTALNAGPLEKPKALRVDPQGPLFNWAPVAGAYAYRVAVLDQADEAGRRAVLAAVWVRDVQWAYGPVGVLQKLGPLVSTSLLPLPPDRLLKVMVAAAREDGSDKSEWASADLQGALAPAELGEAELVIEIGDKWSGPEVQP